MLQTDLFCNELHDLGFHLYSGVPCSLLKELMNHSINDGRFILAANEADAIAIASGAYLGGKKSIVLMQNSGLMNAVSPLTSLTHPFQIPLLGFVSFRGEPETADEPQHILSGQITLQLLELLQIKWEFLSNQWDIAKEQIYRANQSIEKNQSFFFVVKKKTFEKVDLTQKNLPEFKNVFKKEKQKADQTPSRFEVLYLINQLKNDKSIHLATTGKTGRELYEVEDAPHNFYMVGSMGCISSLGLGLALTQRNKEIIVIDGDGSLLMRMGNVATIGAYQPCNVLHILLDNNTHDSTGGQQTVSHQINFVEIAASCGYRNSLYIHNLEELKEAIITWKKKKDLTFLHLRIAKGSKEPLSRPSIQPFKIKERLKAFLLKHSL